MSKNIKKAVLKQLNRLEAEALATHKQNIIMTQKLYAQLNEIAQNNKNVTEPKS